MENFDLKDMTLEYLKEVPISKDLEKAFAVYEKAQLAALALSDINDSNDLTMTKIGTVLSLNLFGMLLGGKKPKELTSDDWKKIANEVTDKAVLMEDRDYSVYVFDLYAEYINNTVKLLSKKVKTDKQKAKTDEQKAEADKQKARTDKQKARIKAIKALAGELEKQKKKLLAGKITEQAYIENCLWISLDAMIKSMSAYIGCYSSEEFGDFIQAASSFAFEYGRLKLYSKEQALLEEYLQNQYLLDDQMKVKFEAFRKELQEETDQFNALIEGAFDPDFRNALMGSVDLARAAGVKDEEILHGVSDVDDFFNG